MADEQKEEIRTGSDRPTGVVLAFPQRAVEPVATPHENVLDRLDRLELELKGLRAAFAAALEQLAVSAPDDALAQQARTTARWMHASFNAQVVLLERLLNP